MFAEDAAAFFSDHAVPCLHVPSGKTFAGMLDMPDSTVAFAGEADVLSTDYALTYIAQDVAIARGDSITEGGVSYTARRPGEKQDDGLFAKVFLKK